MKSKPKSKAQKIALAAGAILGVVLLVALASMTFQEYSLVQVVLLVSFVALAVQDARTGKVNILVLVLMAVLEWIFHQYIFMQVFFMPFMVLTAIWGIVYFIQRKAVFKNRLPFGFGDVVAVPLAMTLAAILAGFWGLVLFGALTALVILPAVLKRKTLRLVPWLLPGVLAAFALGFFL
ncbi:MAG: hypothetical protein NTU57_02605 [Candidatus Aenigmarchaeota archaeon]|nr:hypothetical protein [Candidatus Aenigmarchaeota archaeon]